MSTNYDDLQRNLVEIIPDLIRRIRDMQPAPGIFDLTLTATSVNDDEVATSIKANAEFVELVDDTWVLEDISTLRERHEL